MYNGSYLTSTDINITCTGDRERTQVRSLYDEICSIDNLHEAYNAVCKRKLKGDPRFIRYDAKKETHLLCLQEQLLTGTWVPSPCKYFTIYEPKRREIDAPYFVDCIVHHAIHRVIEPIFEKRFIFHSYACRHNKGIHKAVEYVQKSIRRFDSCYQSPYVVKCDISKYFKNIDHDILINLMAEPIGYDERLIKIIYLMLKKYSHHSEKGVPVGALTSQIMGNIYLDWLDHFMTDHNAAPAYFRYMDDFVIITENKERAHYYFELVKYAVEQLKLQLNPKSEIFPLSRGIDFCGYRMWKDHILPRKRTIKNMRRRLAKATALNDAGELDRDRLESQVASFMGYAQKCDCYETVKHMCDQYPIMLETRLANKISEASHT